MFATKQKQVYDLTKILFLRDESYITMILGPPGSGKSITIRSIAKMVDDLLHGSDICLGTTGTSAFVIYGTTCHSTLCLPINRNILPLQVSALRNLQECFTGKK